MAEYIDAPNPPTVDGAKISLNHGLQYPYDASDDWWFNDETTSERPTTERWSVAAARAIIANLLGRRGIKQELRTDRIDEDVRVEIIQTIALIIDVAPEWWAERTKGDKQ